MNDRQIDYRSLNRSERKENFQGAIDKQLTVSKEQASIIQIKDQLIILASNPHATLHEVSQVVMLLENAICDLPTAVQSIDLEKVSNNITDTLIDKICQDVFSHLNTTPLFQNPKASITLAHYLKAYLETEPCENAPAIWRLIYNLLTTSITFTKRQKTEIDVQGKLLVAKNIQMQADHLLTRGKLIEAIKKYNQCLDQLDSNPEKPTIQESLVILNALIQCYTQLSSMNTNANPQLFSTADIIAFHPFYTRQGKLLKWFERALGRWNDILAYRSLTEKLNYRRNLLTFFNTFLDLHNAYALLNHKLIADPDWPDLADYKKYLEKIISYLVVLSCIYNWAPEVEIESLVKRQKEVTQAQFEDNRLNQVNEANSDNHEKQIISLAQLVNKFLNLNFNFLSKVNNFDTAHSILALIKEKIFPALNKLISSYFGLMNKYALSQQQANIERPYKQEKLTFSGFEVKYIHAILGEIYKADGDSDEKQVVLDVFLTKMKYDRNGYFSKLHETAQLAQELKINRLGVAYYYMLGETYFLLDQLNPSGDIKELSGAINTLVKALQLNVKELKTTESSDIDSWVMQGKIADLLHDLLTKHHNIWGASQTPDKMPPYIAYAYKMYERSCNLLTEFKKSKPNLTNDPAIVEGKRQTHARMKAIEEHSAMRNPNLSKFNV
jgi:hypothetical protein